MKHGRSLEQSNMFVIWKGSSRTKINKRCRRRLLNGRRDARCDTQRVKGGVGAERRDPSRSFPLQFKLRDYLLGTHLDGEVEKGREAGFALAPSRRRIARPVPVSRRTRGVPTMLTDGIAKVRGSGGAREPGLRDPDTPDHIGGPSSKPAPLLAI